MINDNKATYHEIDFLLPAQRFNIQFSYVSEKGLPFIREFMLRMVHVAPMTRNEISTYFGLSKFETEEAISDLMERGELTINESGKLALTEKAKDYFTDIGDSPKLSEVYDAATSITYELLGFNSIKQVGDKASWHNCISLDVESAVLSRSESEAGKHFQIHFHELLDKDFLPKAIDQSSSNKPSVYTVNSVNRLKQLPFRLTSRFEIDMDGLAVERDDFEALKDSSKAHELITDKLMWLSKPSNLAEIAKTMAMLDDKETLGFFNNHSICLKSLEHQRTAEEQESSKRCSLLGPIYSDENWDLLEASLAPILQERLSSKTDFAQEQLIWIAPSDPYWGKSYKLQAALSRLLAAGSTKKKKLYDPRVYVPVSGVDDRSSILQWDRELKDYTKHVSGLLEGFMDGNVEVILLEGELVVVLYHVSYPESLPVSLPIGFISTDKNVIKSVGKIIKEYLSGQSAFDKPHDCGSLKELSSNKSRK